MTFGVQNDLKITTCNSIDEAVEKGFNYTRPDFLPIAIEKAVIVRGGTKGGNPTIDLILVDEGGQKYVVMLTAKLLKLLGNMA